MIWKIFFGNKTANALTANDTEAAAAVDAQSSAVNAPADASESGNSVDAQSGVVSVPGDNVEAGNALSVQDATASVPGDVSETGNGVEDQIASANAPASQVESGLAVDAQGSLVSAGATGSEAGNALDTQSAIVTPPSEIIFVISDAFSSGDAHAEYIRAATIVGSGGLLNESNFIINRVNIASAYELAVNNNALGFIRCFAGFAGLQTMAREHYMNNGILSFMAMGSNDYIRKIYNPDALCSIIGCGAGDTQNRTAYGWSMWFWDQDVFFPGTWESSYSTGYITGLVYKIKVTLGCSWWEAIYRAYITASENSVQSLTEGFGKIDYEAAIAFTGEIPEDMLPGLGAEESAEIVETAFAVDTSGALISFPTGGKIQSLKGRRRASLFNGSVREISFKAERSLVMTAKS